VIHDMLTEFPEPQFASPRAPELTVGTRHVACTLTTRASIGVGVTLKDVQVRGAPPLPGGIDSDTHFAVRRQ
jgi:hypothetical protein